MASETAAKTGIERIADAFANTAGRAALMPYIMGGYPDNLTSRAVGQAYIDGGADLIELGIPYSDPLADGPVIHEAATKALAAGATVEGVLGICEGLAPQIPVVLMTYANIVYARGIERFVADAVAAGACGLIVPDLPLEESPAVLAACDAAGLALVPLVAPTTPDERLAQIGAQARGFLYAVSVVGTTGERGDDEFQYADILTRAKAATQVPVALGFGIGTATAATDAVDAGADGVIIASRLVRELGRPDDPLSSIERLVRDFSRAVS